MFEVSFLSIHCLKNGMLPNFKFVIFRPFYQILNLNLFMPTCHYFVTFTTAANFVYYWTNLYSNFTIGLYYLINIHNFPFNESKFPESWYCIYVYCKLLVKINPSWILLKRTIGIHKDILVRMVWRNNRIDILFLRYFCLNVACCPKNCAFLLLKLYI